jgi:hypothetical protein
VNGDIAPLMLTTALDVSGELHVPTTLHLWKQPLVTSWIGGWVGRKDSLDAMQK